MPAREIDGDADVLGQDPRGGPGRVIAVERPRHAVGEHPAAAGARVDHRDDLLRIESGLDCQRERLGPGREIDRGQQVVDDLEFRGIAWPRADVEDLARNGREERATACERRRLTRDHHRHRAVGGAARPAGDRRVDQHAAGRGDPRRQRSHVVGVDRRCDHDDAARRQCRRRPVRAEQHVVDLRRIDDEDDRDLTRGDERGRRRVAGRTERRRLLLGLAPHVAHMRGKTGAQEAADDAHAHGAGADDACRLYPIHRREGPWRHDRETPVYFAGGGSTAYGSQSRSGVVTLSVMNCNSVPRPRNSMVPLL